LFHRKRHPAEMGPVEITQFLTALAVDRHVSASTQNQALAAILFLYKEVLGIDPISLSMNAKRNQSMERTGGSRYAQLAFVSQWRMPPVARACRSAAKR
jgi:Phage integrase, N-terminal SAM-like domain